MATPGLLIINLLLVWGSVIIGLLGGWRLSFIPLWLAIALGLLLWLVGLAFSFGVNAQRRRLRREGGGGQPRLAGPMRHPFITARLAMNLGVALAFRSWLTLAVALLFYPVAAAVARSRGRSLAVSPKQLERLRRHNHRGQR